MQAKDAASFWGVIVISAIAIAALAVATPFILLVSAIASLLDRGARSSWRPARA